MTLSVFSFSGLAFTDLPVMYITQSINVISTDAFEVVEVVHALLISYLNSLFEKEDNVYKLNNSETLSLI